MTNLISMTDFRRFLDTGLGLLRNEWRPAEGDVFHAWELASYLRLTALQSFAALDEMNRKQWVAYAGERGGVEAWKLTRSGWYARKRHKRDPRIKKAEIPILEKALSVAGERLAHQHEVLRVLAFGPWMAGLNLGSIVIGLECSSWASLSPTRRLTLLQEVLIAMKNPAEAQVVVMGYSAFEGIPGRLQIYRNLSESGTRIEEAQHSDLDCGEERYASQLWRDVIDYGMAESVATKEEVVHGSPYWWWSMQRAPLVDHIYGARAPVQKRQRDPHFVAKVMVSEELFCTHLFAAEATGTSRKLEQSAEPEDALNQGQTELSFLSDRSARWNREQVGPIADELIEKGRLVDAPAINPIASWVRDDLDGREELTKQVLYAARRSRLADLGVHAESLEARSEACQPYPVEYFAAFLVGLSDQAVPFAIVRQPSGHRAHVKEVWRTVENILIHGKYANAGDASFYAAAAVTRFRPATEAERTALDLATKALGKQVRFMSWQGADELRLHTGRFGEHVVKSDAGIIRSMRDLGKLSLTIDQDTVQALIKYQRASALSPRLSENLREWWIDIQTLTVSQACRMLMKPSSAYANRFVQAIDPHHQWQVSESPEGTLEARISCAPMLITLTSLGNSEPPFIGLRIGDWGVKKQMIVRSNKFRNSMFSGMYADLHHFFAAVTEAAPLGLKRAANECESMRERSKDCEGLSNDLRELGSRLIDALIEAGRWEFRSIAWEPVFAHAAWQKTH